LTSTPSTAFSTEADGLASLLAKPDIDGQGVLAVARLLSSAAWHTIDELVSKTGVPRRTVELVLNTAGESLQSRQGAYRFERDAARFFASVYGRRWSAVAELLSADAVGAMTDVFGAWVRDAPKPKRSLDHVPATPETLLRRAAYLLDAFDLQDKTVTFIGDHDLTSMALAHLSQRIDRRIRPWVVDIDEELLTFMHLTAERSALPQLGLTFGDLRLGLPASLRGKATVAFTDPPYTPAGVNLFVRRSLEALVPGGGGRVLLAYGFAPHRAGDGLKVQRELSALALSSLAQIPKFNCYQGAQAIGSRADLYVLAPTGKTAVAVQSKNAKTTGSNIYSQGPEADGAPTAEAPGLRFIDDSSGLGPCLLVDEYEDRAKRPHVIRQTLPSYILKGPAHGAEAVSTTVLRIREGMPPSIRARLMMLANSRYVVVRSVGERGVDQATNTFMERFLPLKFVRSQDLALTTAGWSEWKRRDDVLTGEGATLRALLARPVERLGTALVAALAESKSPGARPVTRAALRRVPTLSTHLDSRVSELPLSFWQHLSAWVQQVHSG
jgi:hypothetical protein